MKCGNHTAPLLLLAAMVWATGCARQQTVEWYMPSGATYPTAAEPVEIESMEPPPEQALPPFAVQLPPIGEEAQEALYTEAGIASWYREPRGRRTASGERYDRNGLTAAHRTLPFGARVRVRNLDNGQEVVVRINDRGPFVRGRIIDLSEAAARRIGIYRNGLARVRIEVIEVSP